MFFSFFFIFVDGLYAKKETSCLKQNGNVIEYNVKDGKNCTLLKTLRFNEKNEITEKGMNSVVGEPCHLNSSDNYLNAENLDGKTVLNNGSYKVSCRNGYKGNIVIKCREGELIREGDVRCVFMGCKKYDHGVVNMSLEELMTNSSFDQNEYEENINETIFNTNMDKAYSKGDVINVLTCKEKEDHTLITGISNGYTLKCNGDDVVIWASDSKGCSYNKHCVVPTNLTGSSWDKEVGLHLAHGGTITQACNADYVLSGTARIGTCSNGTWNYNNTTTICNAACTVPANLTGGTWGKAVGTVVTHGGTITQACNADYILSGTARVGTCSNGSWSYNNTTTICNAPCKIT
ncbi:MAG: hypothetical protein LBS34_01365, partial [Rickettsiales bacterium]|nr:hypothetical protein [Rickettsiales bacterium]